MHATKPRPSSACQLKPSPPKTQRPLSAVPARSRTPNSRKAQSHADLMKACYKDPEPSPAKPQPVTENRASLLRLNYASNRSSGAPWMLEETRQYLAHAQKSVGDGSKSFLNYHRIERYSI